MKLYNQNIDKIENYNSIEVAPLETKVVAHLTEVQLNSYGYFIPVYDERPVGTNLQKAVVGSIVVDDTTKKAHQTYVLQDRFSEPDKAQKEADYLASLVPQSITKLQAMKAMKQTGTMWVDLKVLLASSEDANDEWTLALNLDRQNDFVVSIGLALSKTEQELDDLFTLASTL